MQFPLLSLKVPGGQTHVLVPVVGLMEITVFPGHVRQFVLVVVQVWQFELQLIQEFKVES
jgi:hypothetical protein